MSDNKKQAMIIGTYHLMLGDMGKQMLSGVLGRMKDFCTSAPTEVRFELNLGHPGVSELLVDAYLHAELRKVVKSSMGLDTNPEALTKTLQKVGGTMMQLSLDAAATVGLTLTAVQMAQAKFYTPQILNEIVESVNNQDFTEVDKQLQTFKRLDLALSAAAKDEGIRYSDALVPKEILNAYDEALNEVTKLIMKRDRQWKFPTDDRLLICVGYEHTKFVKDVYRKKGYTILT